MNISRNAQREIRSFAYRQGRGYSSAPIVMEDGKSPPYWAGNYGYYINKSGDIIRHPDAYRRAWGKPIYMPSTRCIMVGRDWIKQLEIDLIQVKLSRQQRRFVNRELAKFIFHFGSPSK
jgi:hypothetical protein